MVGLIYRKAERADQIPEPDMPTQHLRRGDIPFPLRLEHEEDPTTTRISQAFHETYLDDIKDSPGYNEACPAHYLRHPKHSVQQGLIGQMVGNPRQRREARDPEDGGAEELRAAGQEAKLMDVMRRQIVPGRKPLPAFSLLIRG